jgi:hypothetical protein
VQYSQGKNVIIISMDVNFLKTSLYYHITGSGSVDANNHPADMPLAHGPSLNFFCSQLHVSFRCNAKATLRPSLHQKENWHLLRNFSGSSASQSLSLYLRVRQLVLSLPHKLVPKDYAFSSNAVYNEVLQTNGYYRCMRYEF